MSTPAARESRPTSLAGRIAAYAVPALLVVAAVAAYAVPRPVTRWLGLQADPPVIPDDLDNIVRILAVLLAFIGFALAALVALVRWSRGRRESSVLE